ncbi:MAG: hypothetical protein R2750_02930 [Bacteroidales bacterium]
MLKSVSIKIITGFVVIGAVVLLYLYFLDGSVYSNYNVKISDQFSLEIGDPVYVDRTKTGEIMHIDKNVKPGGFITLSIQLPESFNIPDKSKLNVFLNEDSSTLLLNIELIPSYNYYSPGDTLQLDNVILPEIENKMEMSAEPSMDSIPQMIDTEKAVIKNVDNALPENEVQFRVQVMVSSREFAVDSKRFFGLKGIYLLKEGEVIKYFYGLPNSFDEAVLLQKEAQEAGLKDAFVVAYRNGIRISMKEARTLIK